ncbi:LysR family transcriptional regulator [Microbulbifer sp. SH-1]|uniref:TOBE domain-containing protein n=1 Tax=Microbulbifer sp. SH-1 TaxID=2681547 RepID=UPI00140E0A93|nr:TOBE domain-containing protein [Microbulbifer sp. SH-1]QIL89227.1 LysR family transcriptional regulator [Microbulbifer sp. SH-1]
MTKKSEHSQLHGNLAIGGNGKASFAGQQAQLLRAIAQCGSISAAAKAVGISYKTAWDRIDAMNNLSSAPLVVRSAGGSLGGGTALTEMGEKVLRGFSALEEEHALFVERLGRKVREFADVAEFAGAMTMKTSARNQFRGTVTKIKAGAVNAEVILDIGAGQPLVAVITNESVSTLGLETGISALALVKASWVILAKEAALKTSARNQFRGRVSRIEPGAVNSDVSLDLGNGKSIGAIITYESVNEMALAVGDEVSAFFKASSVILMME